MLSPPPAEPGHFDESLHDVLLLLRQIERGFAQGLQKTGNYDLDSCPIDSIRLDRLEQDASEPSHLRSALDSLLSKWKYRRELLSLPMRRAHTLTMRIARHSVDKIDLARATSRSRIAASMGWNTPASAEPVIVWTEADRIALRRLVSCFAGDCKPGREQRAWTAASARETWRTLKASQKCGLMLESKVWHHKTSAACVGSATGLLAYMELTQCRLMNAVDILMLRHCNKRV